MCKLLYFLFHLEKNKAPRIPGLMIIAFLEQQSETCNMEELVELLTKKQHCFVTIYFCYWSKDFTITWTESLTYGDGINPKRIHLYFCRSKGPMEHNINVRL